jgi:pyrimidine-nucleoside phosphorylase
MNPAHVIAAKRDGAAVPAAALEDFLTGYLQGAVEEYQMSAFLMTVVFRGMSPEELDVLVRVMVESGATLDLDGISGPKVDKHSTGGVGDKVSLALAPLAAEFGVRVPMMSGRGLGHTTGTLDKLEAIPGFRTDLPLDRFIGVLDEVGCAMIGQTAEIAPLDRRLYDLRSVSGTVPCIPLISASIMSKKLAEGLDGLLLDVKVGDGAFLPEEDRALDLARTMVGIGHARGVATVALVTAMDRPLGRTVGNALETREALECLHGGGPADLRALVVREAAEMVRLGGGDPSAAAPAGDMGPDDAVERAEAFLDSGAALARMVRMVVAQGGDPGVVEDPSRLGQAPRIEEWRAPRAGRVAAIRPRILGEAVVDMGGGRTRLGQDIDLAVGFELLVGPGDAVEAGQPLARIHARDADGDQVGRRALQASFVISEAPEALRPLVSHRVTADDLVTAAPP